MRDVKVGLRVAALLVVAAGPVVGCSSEPPGFTMSGTIAVEGGALDGNSGSAPDGAPCKASRGYDDIGEGVTVSVFNAEGALVATGPLGPGGYRNFLQCVFPFTVEGVPGGPDDLFQVEVASRGRVSTTGAAAMSGDLALSLGL